MPVIKFGVHPVVVITYATAALPAARTRWVGRPRIRRDPKLPWFKAVLARAHRPLITAKPIVIQPRMIDFGRRRAAGRGLYRVFNESGYSFFRSNVAPPQETDSPFATSSSLPYQPAITFADGTWYLSVGYSNGILDSGFLPLGPRGETYVVLEISGGQALATRPGQPGDIRLERRSGGVIRIIAFYVSPPDGDNRATHWSIGYTTNGSDPAANTPNVVVAMRTSGLNVLSYDLPAQANGTTVKVLLQVRRGTTYSLPGSVLSAIADAAGPSTPLNLKTWSGALPENI